MIHLHEPERGLTEGWRDRADEDRDHVERSYLVTVLTGIQHSQRVIWHDAGYEPSPYQAHFIDQHTGFLNNQSLILDWYFTHSRYRFERFRDVYTQKLGTFVRKSDVIMPDLSSGSADFNPVIWEFESYVQQVKAYLDWLPRMLVPLFPKGCSPPTENNSINKFVNWCQKETTPDDQYGITEAILTAWQEWIEMLREYRNCMVHYSPLRLVLTSFKTYREDDERELEADCEVKVGSFIADNPTARSYKRLNHDSRTEVFQYASSVWDNLLHLDKELGDKLIQAWEGFKYPDSTWI